ncbi:MAG: hypothetical protein M0O99_01650 [Desulfuromonas thiophila]|jgi:hypothetical protein|nr:hypothetical protein [Desulfuromonas thiophila]
MTKIIAWGGLVFGLLGMAVGGYALKAMQSQDDCPIAIIDMERYINEAITGPNGEMIPENVEKGVKKAMSDAKNLADQGFIVLNGHQVLSAPDLYYVSPSTQPADDAE